ncbi:hypothetical protein BJ322DRAFT_1017705 [Thelephora terrestris]|uniref:Uncharacterized protein n=1 Tax=Thelephora terrestris TaxID=56493 RepID=A0A9P6LAT6_9AGAM|nr:hypothetical protein BJ322DRAFT_1017705 [Thelephora terrestris]
MSAFVANNALLNTTATPFDLSPSFKTDAPFDVEQHLYDTPANIAQDNQVAVDFLTAHNAPAEFWEQAGYEDPNRTQSLNEDFSHFALEHWKPFQESLLRYFSHRCHGAYCTDTAPHSPIVPPPSSRSGSSSPSIPSLESCSDASDGGEDSEKEGLQKSDDSYWSTLSSLRQVTSGLNEAESGGSGSPGPLWVRVSERGVDRREAGDA